MRVSPFLQITSLKRNEIVTFKKNSIDKNISSLYNKNISIGQLIHCGQSPDRNTPDENNVNKERIIRSFTKKRRS